MTERLTAVDASTLRYEVTIDDPTTWTAPWTAVTTWKRSADRMFEYACHGSRISTPHWPLTDLFDGAAHR
jgi:hypothetical protein